jgi:catechol 2,3-dioxygenase-like lactoylglutathione lyase family enzyme
MNLYPIVTTPRIAECRDFYVKAFDARVLFQADWYVHLAVANWELGFLKPNPPQRLPVFQHTRPSQGLCVAVEVPDVRAIYNQLTGRGIETLGKPHEFPNGELAFSVVDPAGVILNFVEHRAPASKVIEL